MLQGESGELGLDGINGEEVCICYIFKSCNFISGVAVQFHQCFFTLYVFRAKVEWLDHQETEETLAEE